MQDTRDAWIRAIREAGRRWGVLLEDAACRRILAHWEMVRAAQDRMNLTSLRGKAALYRLVVDSLSALWVYRGEEPAVDVGSGAGYPGMVLAAVFPEAEWTLVEARHKRAGFLAEAANRLGMQKVRIVAERAEELARRERGRYRFAVARAVGNLPLVAELTLPLLGVGGRLLAMRGPEGAQEVAEAQGAVAELGGRIEGQYAFELPEAEGRRVLVLIRKESPTDPRYPRRGGALGRFHGRPGAAKGDRPVTGGST
ncbi:MAG: 16S rRNA (guanine(527)-N(7))-methyltransferase RsmG [Actinomycetia bacterium]|nr:16S rRNA (guanine(527)-N(7))-methyltransferase RsmG [Actinomycetes bacterium]